MYLGHRGAVRTVLCAASHREVGRGRGREDAAPTTAVVEPQGRLFSHIVEHLLVVICLAASAALFRCVVVLIVIIMGLRPV